MRPLKPFVAELVGTAILILLGNGVAANVVLAKPKGRGRASPRSCANTVLPIPRKRYSDWGYAMIPVAGPVIGAPLAVVTTKAFL